MNRIQSILAGLLVVVPVKTLFSQEGHRWLSECELPAHERALIESDLRLIHSVRQEIEGVVKSLRKEAWKMPHVRLLMTIPGFDYCTAVTLMAALGVIEYVQEIQSERRIPRTRKSKKKTPQ